MSFMRNAWPLKYFKARSEEYVYPTDDGKKAIIEDYGSQYEHKPSLIELLANFILRGTGNEEYTWKMVKILAKDYDVEHLLRKKPATWKWISKEMDRLCKETKKEMNL